MTTPRKPSLKQPRNVDKGGIETRSSQPLGRAPLREAYGARSGDAPERSGTPKTLAPVKPAAGKAQTGTRKT